MAMRETVCNQPATCFFTPFTVDYRWAVQLADDLPVTEVIDGKRTLRWTRHLAWVPAP